MIVTTCVALALVLSYLLARERFGRATSLLAVAGVGLGLPVLWLVAGPANTGAAARLVAGALVAYGWVRSARGMATPAWGRAAAGVGAGFLATMPWTGGPIGGGFGLADVLWSSRGGLLATSPAFYVGALGLVALWRVDRAIAATGLTLLAATALLVSSRAAWWTGAWPSPAAFLALTPYVVCGVAAFVEVSAQLVSRRPVFAAGALASVLVVWNVTLMKVAQDRQYHSRRSGLFRGSRGGPGPGPARLDRASAVGAGERRLRPRKRRAARRLRHPRAEPVAGRRKYDWPGRYRHGRRAFRRRGLARGGAGRRHVLPVGGAVRVRRRAAGPRRRSDRAGRRAALSAAEGATAAAHPGRQRRAARTVTLASGWHPAVVTVPRAAWRSGVNHLELRFAYEARPSDAGIPTAAHFRPRSTRSPSASRARRVGPGSSRPCSESFYPSFA